ncbi:LOW QUALITY PROTEIN: hypothetical protein ACHAWF_000639 [Thalassiosira exigua]
MKSFVSSTNGSFGELRRMREHACHQPPRSLRFGIYIIFNPRFRLFPKDEVFLPSGYHLDALVDVYGQRVGIEVVGPSHFIDGMSTPKTMLKQRQVAAIDGIAIVSIPYWEWDLLGNDRDARQRYLWSMLALFSVPYYPPNIYGSFYLHMPSQAHFQCHQRREGLGESDVWFGKQYFN